MRPWNASCHNPSHNDSERVPTTMARSDLLRRLAGPIANDSFLTAARLGITSTADWCLGIACIIFTPLDGTLD